jgi:hypothetical protein
MILHVYAIATEYVKQISNRLKYYEQLLQHIRAYVPTYYMQPACMPAGMLSKQKKPMKKG